MNKLIKLILPLMLASLACMETTMNAQVEPTSTAQTTATQTQEPASGAVFELTDWTPTPETFCAIVTAARSLHLRAARNERAPVVAYLEAGERVTLVEATGTWWKITTATGKHGYSNSSYLQVISCQP